LPFEVTRGAARGATQDLVMTTRPPAEIGMRLDEVDTPALVIDLDAFERNLRRLADRSPATNRLVLGDKTRLIPDHCDPTPLRLVCLRARQPCRAGLTDHPEGRGLLNLMPRLRFHITRGKTSGLAVSAAGVDLGYSRIGERMTAFSYGPLLSNCPTKDDRPKYWKLMPGSDSVSVRERRTLTGPV
jgi:hypothetical protein